MATNHPDLVDALGNHWSWTACYEDGDGNRRQRGEIEADPDLQPVTALDPETWRPAEVAEPVILSWDWREQPDLDELGRTILEMSGGTVHIHAVETGSDQYAIVLADTELDDTAVAEAYRRWYYEDEEG